MTARLSGQGLTPQTPTAQRDRQVGGPDAMQGAEPRLGSGQGCGEIQGLPSMGRA